MSDGKLAVEITAVSLATGEVFSLSPCETRGRYRVWRGESLAEELAFSRRGAFVRSTSGWMAIVPAGQDPAVVRRIAREEDGYGMTPAELQRAQDRRMEEAQAKRAAAQAAAAKREAKR